MGTPAPHFSCIWMTCKACPPACSPCETMDRPSAGGRDNATVLGKTDPLAPFRVSAVLRCMKFTWAILALAACSTNPATAPTKGSGGAGGANAITDAGMSNTGGSGGASVPPVDATDLAAGGGTGGTGDGGDSPRDSADAVTTTGACTGAIACDDFESNTAGAAPAMWTVDIRPAGTGTLQIDTTRAYTGTKSVHITLVANSDHLNSFITQ